MRHEASFWEGCPTSCTTVPGVWSPLELTQYCTSLVPRSPPQLLLQYCKWQGAGRGLGTRLNKPTGNWHIQTVHMPSRECMSHHKYHTLRWWRRLVSCSQTYTVLQGMMGWGAVVYLRLGHSWMYCQDNICSYVTAWITRYQTRRVDGSNRMQSFSASYTSFHIHTCLFTENTRNDNSAQATMAL